MTDESISTSPATFVNEAFDGSDDNPQPKEGKRFTPAKHESSPTAKRGWQGSSLPEGHMVYVIAMIIVTIMITAAGLGLYFGAFHNAEETISATSSPDETSTSSRIRICGNNISVTPNITCDGFIDCPDVSDENECPPQNLYDLEVGDEQTLTWFVSPPSENFTQRTKETTWAAATSKNDRLRMRINTFDVKADPLDTLSAGMGIDPHDESSVYFNFHLTDAQYINFTVFEDFVSPQNEIWIRIRSTTTSGRFEAKISAVTESSLCEFDYQIPCGGLLLQCYNASSRCDGMDDCYFGSDEECEFQCRNGKNVSVDLVCNGFNDCGDHSDEQQDCVCTMEQFDCGDGCVSQSDVCDGYLDCADGGDEANCTCAIYEFECANGNCVPYYNVCDGWDQCGDNSDESTENCRYCPDKFFRCDDMLRCLPFFGICDGITSCSDGSDETRCNATRSLPHVALRLNGSGDSPHKAPGVGLAGVLTTVLCTIFAMYL